MKKAFKITFIVILAAAAVLITMASVYVKPKYGQSKPESIKAYGDVKNAVESFRKKQDLRTFWDVFPFPFAMRKAAPPTVNEAAEDLAESPSATGDHSRTNVQTEGIDEGDIVKNRRELYL